MKGPGLSTEDAELNKISPLRNLDHGIGNVQQSRPMGSRGCRMRKVLFVCFFVSFFLFTLENSSNLDGKVL